MAFGSNINTDPSFSRTTDSDITIASGGSGGYSVQYDPQQQHHPETSTRLQSAAQTLIDLSFIMEATWNHGLWWSFKDVKSRKWTTPHVGSLLFLRARAIPQPDSVFGNWSCIFVSSRLLHTTTNPNGRWHLLLLTSTFSHACHQHRVSNYTSLQRAHIALFFSFPPFNHIFVHRGGTHCSTQGSFAENILKVKQKLLYEYCGCRKREGQSMVGLYIERGGGKLEVHVRYQSCIITKGGDSGETLG